MSPVDWARYPKNWKRIRAAILERANGQCECDGMCGLHHGRRCCERDREIAQYATGTVILTIAHLDHDPTNNDPSNLLAMCQRCHLRYDVDLHRSNRARTVDRKRGQLRLRGLE